MRKPRKQLRLVVNDGQIKAIHNDALNALFGEAYAVDIRRASHVEPDANGWGWSADMSPVGGPVLQDFETRGEALAAEVAYLERHVVT